MKTITGLLIAIILNPLFTYGGSKYEKAMKEALNGLNQATTVDDFRQAANQFDRIGDIEKDKWLPQYHAAYAKVMMASMEEDPQKKDPFLDAAQLNLDVIEKLEHNQSERLALEGFLIMIRMSVSLDRGMELGMDCGMILNQAYTLNNQNPRAVLMLAQFKFGSAQYMGQDTSESCAMFEESLELLDQAEQKESEPFQPAWGRNLAQVLKQQCQN
jgi:hypothetical protein